MVRCLFVNEYNECICEMYFDYESEYFRYLALARKAWHRIITFVNVGYDYDGTINWMKVG